MPPGTRPPRPPPHGASRLHCRPRGAIMRAELRIALALAAAIASLAAAARPAHAVGCTLQRYEWEWGDVCWFGTGRLLQVWNVGSCCTGKEMFRQPVFQDVPCVTSTTDLSTFPSDGEIWAYHCGEPDVPCFCPESSDEVCDGEQSGSGPVIDAGCGDENSCQASARDNFPLTFGTGDVQSNAIDLL